MLASWVARERDAPAVLVFARAGALAGQPPVNASSELELCAACLSGDDASLRALDAMIRALDVSDDAKQVLRHKLLVDRKLAEFGGKGSLGRWLKTVGARLAVDLARSSREDAADDKVLDALLPPTGNLESQAVTAQARSTLRDAVQAVLASLPDRDRLFMQHYHLDGMTLTAIGQLYGVAPSTVMRSLDRCLERVREQVRHHLAQVHGLGDASVDSLVRVGMK